MTNVTISVSGSQYCLAFASCNQGSFLGTLHFRGPPCWFFVRSFDSPWVRNLQDQQSAQSLCPSSITHLALSSWPWAHCRDFICIWPKFILLIVDMLSWWTGLGHVSWAIQGWRLGGKIRWNGDWKFPFIILLSWPPWVSGWTSVLKASRKEIRSESSSSF